jgi:predicted amino acid dehydrogenase
MYDYALIIHPTSEELLHKYEPGMKRKPIALVRKLLEWMSPFKAAEVQGLYSPLGRTAKGTLVMCPLLLDQMASLSPSKVMKAVVDTLKLARSFNPKIIGLTAYTAFSGNKGLDLTKMLNIPLTTGSNYTLATIPESILRAVDIMEMDLEQTDVLLLGVTSSIGRYCFEILSHFVRNVYVTAYNKEKMQLLLSELPKEKRKKLHIVQSLTPILNKIGIVIVATNRLPPDFDLTKFKPGTIVFDASYPRKISTSVRNDILVIDGVTIRPPGVNVKFNFDFGLPQGLCFPCMAEPMILALDRKYENYSLGKDPDIYKVREIMHLAAKHGFEIAGLTSHERAISIEEILKIKNNSKIKKRRKFFLIS